MYFSTVLASQTLMSVNHIWNNYNELGSVLNGIASYLASGGDDTDYHFGYGEKERKEHLISCTRSLEDEVKRLSQLYPVENLQGTFQRILDGIQEIYRLLSEFDLREVVFIPGISNKDALQSRIAELSIFSLVSAIAEHIQTTTPLSGHQAELITSALVAQNPQAAVQQIFTLFEDYLRKRIGVAPDLYGENLINAAFGRNGVLKYGETLTEQAGVRNLFSGVYAVFRNPRMHRMVDDNNKTVLAIITTVDLLIKIIDEAQVAAN